MNKKIFHLLLPLALAALLLTGCAGEPQVVDSGDPDYEAMTIQIEGLKNLDGGIAEISVAELRTLPQHDLDASYKRTTGLYEEFKMSGALVSDAVAQVGGNLDDYEGIGIIGRDNYYCLFSREVLNNIPNLMLALVVDGQAKLDEENYPARIAAQGEFGPYWVKQVAKIILYEEVPQKIIKNVWVFHNLAEGITPYPYEYYGSQDNAIDMEQIFTRLDYVDSKAFFTMKSSDGFKKNEAMNMVKSRYYIKIDGEDAPTNVAPYIKLGMNVHKIAWVSTNADAAVFPSLLLEYMDTKTIRDEIGVPLDQILYEVEMNSVKTETFELRSTTGERYRVTGEELSEAILVPLADGGAKVLWADGYDYADIDNLQRIGLVSE